MKKKYTNDIHAERLLKMFEKKNPCKCCPASAKFSDLGNPEDMWSEDSDPCRICQRFIGLKIKQTGSDGKAWSDCPCDRIKEKVIKNTWIALEKKGYI